MKRFKYTADVTKLRLNEKEQEFFAMDGQKQVFENMCNQAIKARFQNGIGGVKQRSYGRILEKMDKSTSDYILLEDTEFDLLREIFADEAARFEPQQTRIVNEYLNNIENAKDHLYDTAKGEVA